MKCINDELRAIWMEVLDTENVKDNDDFFALGGNSMSAISMLTAVIKKYKKEIDIEGFYRDSRLNKLSYLLSQDEMDPIFVLQSSRPNADYLEAEIPVTANRYSYFMKLANKRESWHVVSPLFDLGVEISYEDVSNAINDIILRYDTLRLSVKIDDNNVYQILNNVNVDDVMVRVKNTKKVDYAQAYYEDLVRSVRSSITLEGPLFRIIYIENEDTGVSFLACIFHHIVCDVQSFRNILNDVFGFLYGNIPDKFPPSYKEYCLQYFNENAKQANDNATHWGNLPFDKVESLANSVKYQKGENIEQYTTFARESVEIEKFPSFLVENEEINFQFLPYLLMAIGKAMHKWSDTKCMLCDLVYHGRFSSALSGISDTCGWISEAVPILVHTDNSSEEMLNEISTQLKFILAKGYSYGYLRYISDEYSKKFRNHPIPEISFNFKSTALQKFNYLDRVVSTISMDSSGGISPEANRVYLLSGGGYLLKNNFQISWDYSSQVFKSTQINEFTSLCKDQLLTILQQLKNSI